MNTQTRVFSSRPWKIGFDCCTQTLGDFPESVQTPNGMQTIQASQLFSADYLANFTQHSADLLVSLLNQSRATVTSDGAVVADPTGSGQYMILAQAGSVNTSAYQQLYGAGVITASPNLQITTTDWNAVAPGYSGSAPVPGYNQNPATPVPGVTAAPVAAPAAATPAGTAALPAWITPAFTGAFTTQAIRNIDGWLATGVAVVQSDGSVVQASNGASLAPAGSVNPGLYQAQTGKPVQQAANTGLSGLTSLAGSILSIKTLFSGSSSVPAVSPVAPPAPPAPPPAPGSTSGGFNLGLNAPPAPPAPPPIPTLPNVTYSPAPAAPSPALAAPDTSGGGGLSTSDILALLTASRTPASVPQVTPAPAVAAPSSSPAWLKLALLGGGGLALFLLLNRRRSRRA